MEDNSKLIAYTAWIDRIKNASNEAFFPLLREFFNLLTNENQSKVKILENEIKDIDKRLNNLAVKALVELEGLLGEIEEEARKEGIRTLPEIEAYKTSKKSKEQDPTILISPLSELLNDAIRHTLESLKNSGKFNDFRKDLFGCHIEVNPRTGEESKFYYIDYSKFCNTYPAFKEYMEYSYRLSKERRKEILPYAAYAAIKSWSDENYRRDMGLVGLGETIRLKIITALNVLVLYFSTKNVLMEGVKREYPKDLQWNEIKIRFLNNHEVIIYYRGKSIHTNYEDMGFKNEKTGQPNKQWEFLKYLSQVGGRISWREKRASWQGKSHKKLLKKALIKHFGIEDDPFYSYRKEHAYEIKITLIPENLGNNSLEEDSLGIKEYWKETSPNLPDPSDF
jgi:hypothetical protein